MADDDDNVVPFRPNPTDPVITRAEAKLKIMQWASAMLEQGLMPDDVAKAFTDYFGKKQGP